MSAVSIEPCANPLLLQWIKEYWDKAKSQNSKSASIYKTAYTSLKACPLTFSHPSEAQQLHGLGPKLCKMLTEKLQEHCSANDLPMPKHPHKTRKRPSDNATAETPDLSPPSPKKSRRKPKPYVPALRSGPYAILLALSTLPEHSSSLSSTSGLTKTQTIDIAQRHCDASFTAPSDPTKYHTAWSSMKTLQAKDYVCEFGRPTKKYALTEEGWEVASRMRMVGRLDDRKIMGDDLEAETGRAMAENASTFEAMGQSRGTSTSAQIATAQHPPALIRASSMPQSSSRTQHRFANFATELNFNEDTANDLVNEMSPLIPAVLQPPEPALLPRANPDSEFIEILSSSPPSQSPRTKPRNKSSRDISTQPPAIDPSNHDATKNFQPPRKVSNLSTNQNPSTDPTLLSLPTFKPIQLPPGSFTIHLILDNREVRSKTDRDYIQSSLLSHGIQPTTRSLEIGDCLWVARVHDPSLLTRYGEESEGSGSSSEIMLDWILERKRLDDLIGSIKDGRFAEQKFRLRRSGVKNVVYVVEDITLAAEVAQKYHEHMTSAIASTQVVDGFFVKRTRKLDDTIRYLARLTRLLKSTFEPRALRVIPSHVLDRQTYLPLQASLKEPHYITYSSFASLASKNDALTLRDVFLKMLMCVRGISGEKAIEIQKRWRTPRAFVEALERCEVENEGRETDGSAAKAAKRKRELVWSVAGNLVGRKKIGKAVSAKVGEIWGER